MPKYAKQYIKKRNSDTFKQYSVRGYKRWIDPFPWVHGTEPEKRVYAELSRRRIPFLFLNDVKIAIPEIDIFKEYQADFVIPSINLIIEVQGAYWHTLPKVVESDAFKFAVYQTAGYRVLGWWDFEIYDNINALFAADPALTSISHFDGNTSPSELPVVKRTKVDTSKGIRTQNSRRALRLSYRRKPVRVKGAKRKPIREFSINVR